MGLVQLQYKLPLEWTDHNAYTSYVVEYARLIQNAVKGPLHNFLMDLSVPIAVVTLGSDARREKDPASLLDLLILTNAPEGNQLILPLEPRLYEGLSTLSLDWTLFNSFERKNLSTEPASTVKGEDSSIFPCRTVDGTYLAGDESLVVDLKSKLYTELISSPFGKKILKAVKSRKGEYRRLMNSGSQIFKGHPLQHFDLDEGLAYDDPDVNVASFKYGPLRFIQTVLLEHMLQHVRRNKRQDIILDVPSGTKDKLFYFQLNGLTDLSQDQIEELADSYNYFLWLYHMVKVDDAEAVSFDKFEVRERIKGIDEIASSTRFVKLDA
jgi:hypothetical protein